MSNDGPILQVTSPYEGPPADKKDPDSFSSASAVMKWKSRVGTGRDDVPHIRLTTKAAKASVYGSTQAWAAGFTDELVPFSSMLSYFALSLQTLCISGVFPFYYPHQGLCDFIMCISTADVLCGMQMLGGSARFICMLWQVH